MMMKKVCYLFVALMIITGSTKGQNDPNAKKILDAVSAKLKTYKGISAGFSLISKSRAGKVNNNIAGKIYLKGNKYYIKEGSTEIFSDGNKTWNYNGNDEVTVTSADADENGLTPQKLLTDFYEKDYTYRLVSAAGNYNEIELIPLDKRKNFKTIRVFVDKLKTMITRAKIVDKSNNNILFSLNNVKTNAAIADNAFVFDKSRYKKDIEVIE